MDKKLYDLTSPQKSIWLTEQYYKNTNINNVCGVYLTNVPVDLEIFEKAIKIYVKNNESYQIRLTLVDGNVKQYFDDYKDFNIETVFLNSEEDLLELEKKENAHIFNLLNSPLYKFTIFKLPNNHGGLIVNCNHIISDSWTSGIVANEITKIYEELKNGNDYSSYKSISYKEYIESENEYKNSEKFKKDKLYWDNILAEIPEIASIPSSKTALNNEASIKAKRIIKNIDKKYLKKIKEYCLKHKVSLYNLFMSIYALYLGGVSGLDNFVIGTPILNRTNFKEKQTTGMFINVLPLKFDLDYNNSFTDFIHEVSTNSTGLLRHQRYSYNYILEDLRKQNPSIPGLYDVLFSYQITKMNEDNDKLPHRTRWTFNDAISNSLEIHVSDWNDDNILQIDYDYKIDKYSEEEIVSIHERILHILDQILNNENILMKEIEVVTEEEKSQILYEINNTKEEYPKDKTIPELFEEQVEQTPDNIALSFEDKKLTYKELNEKVNSLANYLSENGIKELNNIGIFTYRSLNTIIGILALLKLNCTYVPIDPEYPETRIKYMLETSKVSYILGSNPNLMDIAGSLNFIDISDYSNYPTTFSKKIKYNSKNNLYIIFTSGSTGKPKGVCISHQNIVNLIFYEKNNTDLFEKNSHHNILQFATMSFDVSYQEIFSALLTGNTLVLIKDKIRKNIFELSNYIDKFNIDTLFIPPAYLKLICNDSNALDLLSKNVENIITAGEKLTLTPEIVALLHNNTKIYNHYGPAETHVVTSFKIDKNNIQLAPPIGKPIANAKVYILDKTLNLCPKNTVGQICIAGDCVGNGYFNNEELSQNKFIDNPFGAGKLYLTGDLGFLNDDGLINFVGRDDFQVKINGFRIELEEIDSIINSYDEIMNCITIPMKIKSTGNSLVSYFVSNTESLDINKLKQYVRQKLPNYMMPQYFISLKELPFSPNGKIDRKALPLPKIDDDRIIVKPRNKMDDTLLNIIGKILNIEIDKISIEDNFFDMGGDSLSAISLSAQIHSQLNLEIFVKDIMQYPIISELSDFISSISNNEANNILEKAPKADYYSVSSKQKSILLASKMDGENSLVYNMPGTVIFDKMPDIIKLQKCFDKMIERHESFRTYFDIEDGQIVQKILNKVKFNIEFSETTISSDDIDNELKNFAKPFDFSRAPLLRAKLLKLENGKAILFVDMHHIISDGISISIFIDELSKLYNSQSLEKIEYTYKDYTYLENEALSSDKFKEAEEFWVNQFKSDIPVLNMPTNYSRPAIKSYQGSKVYSKIGNETFKKINNICKEFSVTPYMLLLSVYYILLSKYTGQDDIVVGSPIVGRNVAEFYNIIGMFVNTLPMRSRIDSSLTFKEFLINVKNLCLENYKYQDYPLNELMDKLSIQRDTSRSPLFDTLFTYQNNGFKSVDFDGINSEFYIPDMKISKYDLSLEIVPGENKLNLNFEYCTKLFTKQFIENLSNHYKNILEIVINNLDTQISSICMLSKKEKNQIIYEFNNTKTNYPKNKTITQLFEEQVEKTPDNIAIVFGNKELTYKALNEKANSLAHYLINNNVERGDFVGIMVNRSLEMIISILAVLKSGATYIPIDPEYPQDRIEYMLGNSNAKVLLTFEDLENKVSFENKIFVELSNKQIYSLSKKNLENKNQPNDSCYIIYTSGSTGLPKGVVLKHSNIVNFIYGIMNKIPFNNKDVIVSITTISFDIFVLESLLPLINGIKIILASEKEQTDITLLNDLCIKNNVTIIQTTPSRMLSYTLESDISKFIKKIKYFLIGGEAFNKALLENLQNNSKGKIYNMYGPTETAVWSSIKDLSDTDKITIGTPISNTQLYILDNNLVPLPVGIPGELYISGDGVCKGYFNRPELNKKAFIPNPFIPGQLMYKTGDFCELLPNGEIEYIERIDNQVKIRGLRIELGEIESKIASFPNIKKACVIKQTINNRDFISAYFTIKKKINIVEIRKYLSNSLPKYMIPSYFTVLEDFPYTPNGKINKKALPLPKEILSNSNEKYVAPKTDLQIKITNIFEQVLNTSPIGINDNFFDLGGDSILAMNLNIELQKITDKISYADIFKFPSVSELENKINSQDEDYDYKYMEQNYDKYKEILSNNSKIPKKYELKYKEPGNIILTGSTGFLGIHILESFIKSQKGNVYCIIREEAGLTAELKLQQKLHYYFGDKYDKLIGKRIFTIRGDICSPGFGLGQEELLELSNNADIVINSAAKVSHYGNYTDFYNVNVKSVRYMIDFCKSFNKKFYQISTLSVSGNSLETSSIEQNIKEETLFEENNLYIGQSLENVYVRSKFEAECLVLDSILDGLDAYILRVGNLMPRYRDGVFQENIQENAYINRIVSFLKIGLIPDYLNNIYLELTPIDLTANAIIKLITYSNEINRVFHLYNHNHVYLKQFLKHIDLELEIVDEEIFKDKVRKMLKNSKTKESLNFLMNDFDKDLHLMYLTDIIIKSENTIKYLEKIGFSWPNITERYICNFIDLLRRLL